MAKKIFANLKDETQTILFNDDYENFLDIENIFTLDVNSFNTINFFENINSQLKHDELYTIQLVEDNFQEILSHVKLNLDSIDNNIILGEEYKKVKFLYLVDSDNSKIYFKWVLPLQHIENKKFLGFNGSPTFLEESNKINLNSNIDVVYDTHTKILYFRKFGNLKTILPNVKDLYRLASDADISSFFDTNKFDIKDSILEKLNSKMRSRLGLLIDKEIDFGDNDLMSEYEIYDSKYKNKLKKDSGKYQIKTKPQLINFMELLEERFYETPITKQKREADAYRNIEEN